MSFTKVAPAGIGTEPGSTIRLGDSLLHSTGLDIGVGSGIGVTIRQHGDATFTGIITASAFFGDGSGLEGVSSSGIGTALSDDDTSSLNKIYYANQELSIGSTVTVNHPDTGIAAYTHYQDLVVKDNADFIVADGDTFIPDVLGINTSSLPNPVSSATGGRIRAGTITNAGANGAPNFPNGLTGTAGTFTGNLNVGGVLTYEDVTNVDSIGIVTARGGIRIGAGTTVGPVSGIVTYFGDGSQLTGISAGTALSGSTNNTVTTVTGANAITGEANLKFDGSGTLTIVDTELAESTDNFSINIQSGNNDFYVKSGGTVFAAFKGSSKDLQLTSGNLVIGTSGKGIDFSATANATVMNEGLSGIVAPTMDNELLKSYERGTWTGKIRGYDHAGGAGWGVVATTAGTNSATGRYIKIGNLVHAFIRFTGITWDTNWTYFSIQGVPFGHNHYDGAGGFCLAHDTNFFTNTGMTVMGNVWGSQGNLVGQKPTGTTNLTLDTSNNNRQLYATLIFYTSTGG